MFTAAPLLDTAAVSEQMERGGGVLGMSQLTAGITTYDDTQAGIAITGVDLAHGTLQYSTDGGSSWTNVATVSDSSALLLADNSSTELRLEPTDAYIGDLDNALTFRAWDQVTGTDGSYVDATTSGGDTAFSDTTADASIEITPLIGSPISVGSSTNDNDVPPALLTAVDGEGTSVVAWQDGDDNLIVQFYSASGTAIGSSFQVNPSGDPANSPTVSANANGTFAFAWRGNDGIEVHAIKIPAARSLPSTPAR